jgi:hypothetical protein
MQEGKASSVSDAQRIIAAKALPVAKEYPIVYLSHSEELGPLSKRTYPFAGLSISLTSLASLPLPIAMNSILFLLVPAGDLSSGISLMRSLGFQYARDLIISDSDSKGAHDLWKQHPGHLLLGKRGNNAPEIPEELPEGNLMNEELSLRKPDSVCKLIEHYSLLLTSELNS